MIVRYLFLFSLAFVTVNAHAYGAFPPYTPEEPTLGLWLVLGVLAFVLAARRQRFDTDESN